MLDPSPESLCRLLRNQRFPLDTEVALQYAIERVLRENDVAFEREVPLDERRRPDFMVGDTAIETKIKGAARAIYRQCLGYCEHPSVGSLILITNRAVGFPSALAGKPCYVINLGSAWL